MSKNKHKREERNTMAEPKNSEKKESQEEKKREEEIKIPNSEIADENKDTEENTGEEDKSAKLEARIKELETLVAQMQDDNLRRAADTENFKKRLRLDKENAIKYANEQLIGDLLTPIENFSRVIEAANTNADFESMKKGVIMVEDQLLSVLKSKWGLEMIAAKGKEFDPNTMEAYSMQEL